MQENKTPAFDIDRTDLYNGKFDERTRTRLTQILNLGMSEVSIAEFGAKGIMSGLYIERVWSYSDEEFSDYLQWAKSLIDEKQESIEHEDSQFGTDCECGGKMKLAPSGIVYQCGCGSLCYTSS